MSKVALITGIAGQDGSYLSELLVDKGYDVHGIVRRHSIAEHQESRIDHLSEGVTTHYGDLLDPLSIHRIVGQVKPDEVYNLAAQSHVRISFDMPIFTAQTNAIGAMHVIDAVKTYRPDCKYYQASSSEMFGNSVDEDGMQRESTPLTPVSPYGIAKVFAYNTVRHYRQAYKMHATNGILFNHESPRRGSNFVTVKVVKTAVQIKKGLADKLAMGNMDSMRDWGHSKDYVKAMWMMMQQDDPGDWVVSTMETHSVRDLCSYVFKALDMNYEDYVEQDPRYMRAEELKYLCGDSTKFRELSGWQPQYSYASLLDEMIEHWMRTL
jgi:GDPmannose 4,6-dehydratase